MPFNHNLHPKTRDQIAKKVIIPIVGPTSVGKTTLMRAVAAADKDIYRSRGFTTRPRQTGEPEDTYRFLPNTPKQQQELIQQMATGELLQSAIHPETGYLYGTNIDDYQGKYNIISTLSSEVANFQAMGFYDCKVIMLVAAPTDWQKRFFDRDFSKDEANKRIKEGITSINWALAQDGGVRWVENKQDRLDESVSDIITIVKNLPYQHDQQSRDVAAKLLHHLIDLTIY